MTNSVVALDPVNTVGAGGVTVIGTVTISGNNLAFVSPASFEVKSGGYLIFSLNSTSGGNLIVRNSATFEQHNALPLSFASVSADPGGVFTHSVNSTARTYILNMNVTGDFVLPAGAAVIADYKGYVGGGGNGNGNGPGYGTFGGTGGAGEVMGAREGIAP